MFPPQYACWFPTEDDESSQSDSTGHSCSPDLDFQVPLAPDDQYDSYSSNSTNSGFSTPGSSIIGSITCITDTRSDIDIVKELKLNTPESLYRLFEAQELEAAVSPQQRWSLRCPNCKEWCQTSISSAIPLWAAGQFKSLSNHRGSKKCAQMVMKKQKQTVGGNVLDGPISRSCSITSDQRHPSNIQSLSLDNHACAGIAINWPDDLRPFLMMFPWESYHNGPNALPFTVNITHPTEPCARSKHCLLSTTFEDSCNECTIVHKHISRLVEIARDPKAHTNYKYLGLAHIQDIAKMYAAQACNDSRKYMTALTQLDDYNRLLMAISENDIPRLQQIIKIALDNGASIREVVNKLEDAMEGAYRPRGCGSSDIDIATLVFRLGGHQLLFALNHKLGIPSIRTLRARSTFTSIAPTLGLIRDKQLDENIQSIILNTRQGVIPLCGVSLMIDELALQERVIYFGKYNKIDRLCWKHANVIDPILHTYDSAVRIAHKIHKQEVHLGKEVTVIGVASAPTCKTEDAADMEGILARAIEHWNATGAATRVGPVWSFATDGDATRRAAGHRLFLKKPLSADSPLYATLTDMPGLNTFMGNKEVTLDFNFKHIFKCICTLICSPAGITLNNGRIINAMMLSRYLLWLPAYDKASVTKVLHLDDPQDVPCAIELMQAIIAFSKLKHASIDDSFSTNIDIHTDLMAIKLLGHILESILLPFIDVNLSLTEQVQYLSSYSHLSFAMFYSHRRGFMPYQLYYDTHTMAKNIMFCIKKQQVLDLHEKFFIGDCGNDCLELHFGRTRMIGGHNSGCSYSQVLDRLGAAKDIDGVFKRHPDLDLGHQHLKMGTWLENVDHINWEMWKGDLVSNRSDLPSAWQTGRDMALAILIQSQLNPISFSFVSLFADPAIDMLRLFGMNKYLGISEDDPEDVSLKNPPAPPRILQPHPTLPDTEILHADSNDEADEPMLNFEVALAAQADFDLPHSVTQSITAQSAQSDPSAPPFLKGKQFPLASSVPLYSQSITSPRHLPAVLCSEGTNLLMASDGERLTTYTLCPAKVTNMRSHIGLHILRALRNTPGNVLTDMVELYLLCRLVNVTLVASAVAPAGLNAPSPLKYGYADAGSKHKPCHNVPLKCELCHPILPPEPGSTVRRTPLVTVDAVWRYNLPEHIVKEHEVYSVPGLKSTGIPLPAGVLKAMRLSDLEEIAAQI
ncbi:hypothetical protein P692DRAFT_20879328 [Suillus brevipes Sb2]|nr:hypothetical protein P692DRAFT_20879328 [Suillus brevipes Sb2]